MHNKISPDTSALESDRFNRRRLLKGAAWSAPVLLVAAAAPAAVASSECSPQTAAAIQTAWAIPANFGTWTRSSTSVERRSDFYGLANVVIVENDAAGTFRLTSAVACLGPGTYEFAFNARIYNLNPRTQTLTAEVVTTTGTPAIIGTASVTSGSGNVSSASRTFQVTVTRRTAVQFRYGWVTASGGGTGDDIAATAPTVTKL